MKISFACPSCGASGSADEALVGRQVRCKPCQHRFAIPAPAAPGEDDEYGLDDPIPAPGPAGLPAAVYVPARGEESTVRVSPRRPKAARKARRERPEIAWGAWLVRGGAGAAVILVLVALLAPRGLVIAGSILLGLGSLMVLAGYFAGAYGAFSEDFLYGFLYLVLPLYSAYYLITRWDDLWRWAACSTAGVALIALGTRMLGWAGVTE